ncbi:uncharacterized protein LOC130983285 [Arachis stenosperma]|uniref:uncharacterized protein LOC130983285 n=1 Tax=Arachis stenosperma TaxID=217475 RepID=UPI0025ABF36B|nr:uncharacterized protein LOC130983285 [Arachis stenosperma]
MMFVRMPRKPRYNIIREPPKDAGTNAGTEEATISVSHCVKVESTTRGAQTSREQPRDRAPPISSTANRAPTTRMNEPFRAPRIDHSNAQSSTENDPQTPTDNIETRHCAEVADRELEDEDYDPEADEVPLFDDHIDDLFAVQEVEGQHNNKKAKDTDFWEVIVIEDGVRKVSKLSVKEAIALPSNTKIELPFNSQLQPIGQRVFHYEDDAGGKIKSDMLKRIGKNWKDTRNHLFHMCYKQIRTYEENLKHHPAGIDKNDWKKFVDYRLKEETQKKCKQNALNRSKQLYTHIGGSKTLARKKDEVEAIANVERQDGSSKHLSQNDSLSQVLGKEHPGRVRVLGAGPCPTQVFGNAAGQPLGSAESNAEDKRMIVELTAKLEEERVKRQLIHKVLGYVVQQLGGNLPIEIAVEMASLGGTLDSSCAGPFSSGNQDPQQKS